MPLAPLDLVDLQDHQGLVGLRAHLVQLELGQQEPPVLQGLVDQPEQVQLALQVLVDQAGQVVPPELLDRVVLQDLQAQVQLEQLGHLDLRVLQVQERLVPLDLRVHQVLQAVVGLRGVQGLVVPRAQLELVPLVRQGHQDLLDLQVEVEQQAPQDLLAQVDPQELAQQEQLGHRDPLVLRVQVLPGLQVPVDLVVPLVLQAEVERRVPLDQVVRPVHQVEVVQPAQLVRRDLLDPQARMGLLVQRVRAVPLVLVEM